MKKFALILALALAIFGGVQLSVAVTGKPAAHACDTGSCN
jgi:hypothetical protein